MARGKGIIGASLDRINPQRRPVTIRARSQDYDEIKAARAVRRLSKTMRAVAAQREAVALANWSYIVETTLEEMEAEAEAEQKLMELRIALLQVQPAARKMLQGIRTAVVETSGDQALALLKYAVAWRRVFGPHHSNKLQSILDLAAMGAAVRNHVDERGQETIYLATAQDLESFSWNRKGAALEPSNAYIGSGYSIGRNVDSTASPISIGPAPSEVEVDLRGTPAPQVRPNSVVPPVEQRRDLPPRATPELSHPHVSTPHHVATDPRAHPHPAHHAHPGVDNAPPVAAEPGDVLFPPNMPSAREQIDKVMRDARIDINRFGLPRSGGGHGYLQPPVRGDRQPQQRNKPGPGSPPAPRSPRGF